MNICRLNTFPAIYMNHSAIWFIQRRCKSKVHWAKLKKKTGPTHKALQHFDEFYGSVFAERWEAIRKAMLRTQKYVALVNNYGDTEETMEMLTKRGAHCVKRLIEVDKTFREEYYSGPPKPKEDKSSLVDKAIESYSLRSQEKEISSLYPGEETPSTLEAPEMTLRKQSKDAETEEKIEETEEPQSLAYQASLDAALSQAQLDESRLISPGIGLTSEALMQYVPATKLKGMEDWVPESQHYEYYNKGKDFPLNIEMESEFEFPEHLKVFSYELENVSLFPEPRRSSTGVFNYYPLDGGSVMSVLALGLQGGERVLDVCAAPGGKSLVALQTLLPDIVVCLDSSLSRINRMNDMLRDYLPGYQTSNKWQERIICRRFDSRFFIDEPYDKVLVDVPCTTDRHSIKEDDNNIFRPDRIKERLRIPEAQAKLLVNGLRLTRVGGTLVYSTCSLSPIQNDGVVHNALKLAFEHHHIEAVIKNMSEVLSPFKSMMRFGQGTSAPRYGTLVTPHVAANFGPTYFAKIVRTR